MPSLEDVYLVPGLGHELRSYMGLKDRMCVDMTCSEIKKNHMYEYTLDTDSFSDDPQLVALYLSKHGKNIREIKMSKNKHCLALPENLKSMPNLEKITYAVPLYIATETKSIEYTTIQCWQSIERFLDTLMTTTHKVKEFYVTAGDIVFRTTIAKNTYEDTPMNMTNEGIHNSIYTLLRSYPLVREPVREDIRETALKKVRICLSMLSPKACFYLRKFTTVSDWGFADAGHPFLLQHF